MIHLTKIITYGKRFSHYSTAIVFDFNYRSFT